MTQIYIKQMIEAGRYINTIRPYPNSEDAVLDELVMAADDLALAFGHGLEYSELVNELRLLVRQEAETRNISFIEAAVKIMHTFDNMLMLMDEIKDSKNPYVQTHVDNLRNFKDGQA